MQRQTATYRIAEGQYKDLKGRMLNWARQFGILLFLDSNNYEDKYGSYACLLAVGNIGDVAADLKELQTLHDSKQDWLFGHICYDHKNRLETLSSARADNIGFPEFHFFRPAIVCYVDREQTTLTIESLTDAPGDIWQAIQNADAVINAEVPALNFQQRIDKQTYINTISALRRHIADGDCYEINFCNEGYCENAEVKPLHVFNKLNTISPAPFAAYYRNDTRYMMCASPERYIHKQGSRVLSQPIKGTARRDMDALRDEAIKTALYNDIKERAENVMIVDLVRNDLARSCETGSVQVDELFGIYTFPQVHQMISTVSAKLKEGIPFTDAIRYSFPMGSMTGAPKVKVLQLIEQYEHARRGLFSGTVGYISPKGDFDFNVIIRSLFYNAETRYLSYQTGGAITYDSVPEQEWEEMRLKAWALEKVFS